MQLLDLLTTLIAFAVVMLLLSLIVTAMVQMSLQLLGLRARNLKWGLEWVLWRVVGREPEKAREEARKVIQSVKLDSHGFGKAVSAVTSPALTWIDPQELPDRLKTAQVNVPGDKRAELVRQFSQLEGHLSNRFTYQTRLVTIFWAVLVAFYFQVAAPELLRRLWHDAALRERIAGSADRIYEQVRSEFESIPTYADVADEALAELTERHPALAERLEEASGVGPDREDLIEELSVALADHSDQRAAILEEYGLLLDQLHVKQMQQALAEQPPRRQADATPGNGLDRSGSVLGQLSGAGGNQLDPVSELAGFDFDPWKEGWGFYWDTSRAARLRHDRLAGVLLTTILLTFGAPFWFEMLKSLLKLRDVLAEREETKQKSKTETPQTVHVHVSPERPSGTPAGAGKEPVPAANDALPAGQGAPPDEQEAAPAGAGGAPPASHE